MAVAAYASDLQDIIAEMPATTGWTALGGGAGGLVAPETDFFKQGANCISKAGWSAATKGMIYNFGSGVTVPAGSAVFFFVEYWAAAALATEASGGIQALIGSGSAAFKQHYASGSDYMSKGRFPCLVVDPTRTADATTGTPTATLQYFGAQANVPAAGPSKGQPLGIDAIRYGRDFTVTGGDLANGYATLTGAVAYNNVQTRQYGQLDDVTGEPVLIGRLMLGSAATAVDFRDSNKTLKIGRTPCVGAAFSGVEVTNAGSRADWTGYTFKAIAPTVQRGYFKVNSGLANHAGCTFEDIGTTEYSATSTSTSHVWRRCDQVRPVGATVSGALFEASNDTTGALLINSTAQMLAVTACNFKTNAKAIKITAAGTYTFDGHQFTGNTVQVDFTGTGTCTINPTNGCNVIQADCVATGGGTIVVNAVQVTYQFTLSPAITGYEWRLYVEDPAAGIFGGTELAGEETATVSTQSYSYVTGDAGTNVVLQIIATGYEESLTYFALAASSQSQTITLSLEENT